MTVITVGSKEAKFKLDEVGFECIDAIKLQMERLGWHEPYDECETKRRFELREFGSINITDIYLEEENVMVAYYPWFIRHKTELSSLLIHDQINAYHLQEILEALEKLEG